MDKDKMWNYLKDDLEWAVDIGYGYGYDSEIATVENGQFQAYRLVLDLMNELEGRGLSND